MFRRGDRKIRRWYRKKRWWIVVIALGLGWYNSNVSGDSSLQDQINSLTELIPFLND